jgi:predicted nuclease of restriction endonuclease-like (RecB) superfamily
MNEYFKQINELISKRETTRYVRNYVENEETLVTYWHIGKLLSEVGTKYGEGTIKKWSNLLIKKYGNNYNITNLQIMKQFFLNYSNYDPLAHNLNITWTNIRIILTIKDKNVQNYYLNLCMQNNLTKRKLIELIKNNTYEKLPFNERNKTIVIDTTHGKNNLIPVKNPIIVDISENDFKEQILLKYFSINLS